MTPEFDGHKRWSDLSNGENVNISLVSRELSPQSFGKFSSLKKSSVKPALLPEVSSSRSFQ